MRISTNFSGMSIMAVASFCLISCSEKERKIGEDLSRLETTIQMSNSDIPHIGYFFDDTIYVKREKNDIKWKFVLKSTKYKNLAEELTNFDSYSGGDSFVSYRNARFKISFIDNDGFVIHEVKAGESNLIKFSEPNSKNSSEGSDWAKPVLSKIEDEVSYFGVIRSSSNQIDKIEKVRIECLSSKKLEELFKSVINSEKEKN